MNRRTFLASLPCIAAVGEEKKETFSIEAYVINQETSVGYNIKLPTRRQAPLIAKACLDIWGPNRKGQKMICTVHPDGYDVRFAKG